MSPEQNNPKTFEEMNAKFEMLSENARIIAMSIPLLPTEENDAKEVAERIKTNEIARTPRATSLSPNIEQIYKISQIDDRLKFDTALTELVNSGWITNNNGRLLTTQDKIHFIKQIANWKK